MPDENISIQTSQQVEATNGNDEESRIIIDKKIRKYFTAIVDIVLMCTLLFTNQHVTTSCQFPNHTLYPLLTFNIFFVLLNVYIFNISKRKFGFYLEWFLGLLLLFFLATFSYGISLIFSHYHHN
ncbi:hypothetical protein EDEG_00616 [Edhazardia aedis USNM 41457]|uniref:Uncharacterized protein n=1 Tax=Edhazardia aedis (strain USNM 41457) TaxID=1003232 RepID=J9A079_EDHAE|nr:hypothetical protein EDEG_00616 [Edhazardia aedis USNM 41457]|eukprot:EJW05313.1 hypothetical protein EDEG_00616 [Edhazardia aedis USNM 41457]